MTMTALDTFVAELKPAVIDAVPPHVPGEWMLGTLKRALSRDPKLSNCTRESLVESCTQAAALGLEPNTPLQHCYLIPRGGECTLHLGYEGLIALAFRTDKIEDIDFRVVREGDFFEWQHGDERFLKHREQGGRKRAITHAYAMVRYKTGGMVFEVMDREEIERRRNLGGAKGRPNNSTAWVNEYATMCAKTVWLSLSNRVPMAAAIPLSGIPIAAPEPDSEPIEVESTVVDAEPPTEPEPEPPPEMTELEADRMRSLEMNERMVEAGQAEINEMTAAKAQECLDAGISLEEYTEHERVRYNAYKRQSRGNPTMPPYRTLAIGQTAASILAEREHSANKVISIYGGKRTGTTVKGLPHGRVSQTVSPLYAGMTLAELTLDQLRLFYGLIATLTKEDRSYLPLLSVIAMAGQERPAED